MKRSSLERKSKKERRGFYSKLALCFLALIVAAACVVNAQEKISDFTYTYPQDPDYDPYPAQQDPDFIKLTDGRIGAGGTGAVWGTWEGKPRYALLLDLKKKYVVDQIKIWTSEEREYHHIGSFEVHASSDGENFQYVRTVVNPNPKLEDPPSQRLIYAFGEAGLAIEARFLMIVIVRDSTAGVRSQILEEIEVWGQEIPLLKTISLSKQSFAPQLGSLTISYEAAGEVMLTAEVLTRSGQHVAGLIKDEPVSGLGTVQWDGKDKNGEYASAGTYILRLTAKNETQVCIRTAGVDLIREGPPPPQIVTNFPTTVNRPEITLTATSSPGLSLKVSLNGEVVGQYSADAQGLCVFTVANLQAGANEISVSAVDGAGCESQAVAFPTITYDQQAAVGQVIASPAEFAPAVGDAQITFYLAEAMSLGIRIKRSGITIAELEPLSEKTPGQLQFAWDGKDSQGRTVADGIYRIEVFDANMVLAAGQIVVNSQPPGKPRLFLPEDGSRKSEGFVDFIWSSSAGVKEYLLSIWPTGRLEDKITFNTSEPHYRLVISPDLVVGQWQWQVVAVSGAGLTTPSDVGSFIVDWRQPGVLEVRNLQLGPNPFSPASSAFNKLHVSYTLTQGAKVEAQVYNLAGKRVFSFPEQFQGMGDHLLVWDGRDESGRLVSKGVYVLLLTVQNDETRGKSTIKRVFSVMY
ncbi:MAG: hypothetical protein GX766_03060 [Firmicutes bacterium]|nr:hypothetical protein [Bacillota bacterium]